MADSGLFITFEGGEGAGKSTQVELLAKRLIEEAGCDVVRTREPGGSPGAEQLRELLVTGDTERWSAEAEALLNYAARDDHLRQVIRPALEAGKIVLCDRFMDSTRAYQGYAGRCDLELINALETAIVGDARPQLTFIFDLDPQVGLARASARGDGNDQRYERKGLAFHAALRDAFAEIAARDPERCVVIDASLSRDEVAEIIWEAVAAKRQG